ncbi:MAG: hypothetical protein MJZ86_08260 [Bacteroidales bacterium]|nr:hypothetical protein [Bacteroidales bacterium]
MAILTGINTQLRGSAGGWTFAQLGGETIAKQKVAKKSTAKRTMAVMRRRVQMGNLVNVFRSFAGTLHPSFEGKSAKVTDYNEFMGANFGLVPVYLTKTEARGNGAVVAAYQITRGSMPTIEHDSETPGKVTTDIALGDLTIDGDTTVADFSRAVVQNNEDYAYGDQISVYVMQQMVNSDSHVPIVRTKAYEVTLAVEDEEDLLATHIPIIYAATSDGKLGNSMAVTGGICYVHSRKTGSGTKVSTQRLVVNNSVLASYQSRAALDKAVQSYGGLTGDQFLTPDVEDVVAPVRP